MKCLVFTLLVIGHATATSGFSDAAGPADLPG
jgi:hypothetical protein